MEEKAEYNTPNQNRKEYRVNADFVVDLPAHLNACKIFDAVHDFLVAAILAHDGKSGGEWHWSIVVDDENTDEG